MKNSAPRNLLEVLRDEMYYKDKILAALNDGPKTIPEIAEAVGAPAHEVVRWVMALRRYGKIEEQAKSRAEDYYSYTLSK